MPARRSRARPTDRRRRATDAAFDVSDGQLRVGDVLARLLPRGSAGGRPRDQRAWHDDLAPWQVCPAWPLALGRDRGYSLDERNDGDTSLRVGLSGVHGVRDPRAEAWLEA